MGMQRNLGGFTVDGKQTQETRSDDIDGFAVSGLSCIYAT